MPREPSTPRIAVWRRLKELGVAQLGDGLVALPSDARTKELLEWVAHQIEEHAGEAMVWIAEPSARRLNGEVAQMMSVARTAEYGQLLAEIEAAGPNPDGRSIAGWRRKWRKIDRRDYFRANGRDEARLAIPAARTAKVTAT